MEKLGLNEIREKFLSFFESKDHYRKHSYSLVPENDKSLLLINAGMAPLKPFFMGTETPPKSRMTTCQKCIRTGDIENVGITARHATFFEMLGNFSFGDYFKTEAISWCWEFVIEQLNMPKDSLWVTVYEEDDEAFSIWEDKIGFPKERIVKLGKDDNFWEIGVGPCGPCSEIYFDRGEKYSCDNPDCKPGCECDRYVEFWNLVFTQYYKDEEGNYTPLPKPNIDTGMGLERVACLSQGVETIFDVDTIKYILDHVVELSGQNYQASASRIDQSIRLVTDHIRSVVFLVSDGVLPSNEGRGYVVRRLLRRAARHGKLIGIEGKFLSDMSDKVIAISKNAYPELEEKMDYIKKIINIEEDRFRETIDQGNNILMEHIEALQKENKTTLSGEKAFKLYDTYGFPVELTEEILNENQLEVDVKGFNDYMEQQRNQSRNARHSDTGAGWKDKLDFEFDKELKTEFIGYDQLNATGAKVLIILKDNQSETVANENDRVKIIIDQTPFYAESGGQVGDIGLLSNDDCEIVIENCVKMNKTIFVHEGFVKKGQVSVNDLLDCKVDALRRGLISKNHTATHMLHRALRSVLGNHVEQAGSLVTPEKLRFDFSHFQGVEIEELEKVEQIVNEKIMEALAINKEEMEIDAAIKLGATALFGEKYDQKVRVVTINGYSMELCGGTHIENTSEIGIFKILGESGVAAGVRRIEAITSMNVYHYLNEKEATLETIQQLVKSNPQNITQKIESLILELKDSQKEVETLKSKMASGASSDLLKNKFDVNGIGVIVHKFENTDAKDLRTMADEIKKDLENGVIVFGSVKNDKVNFLVMATDDVLDKGIHAGQIVKQVAQIAGGGGGGKANMAQAGGKNPEKIDEALDHVKAIIKNIMQ